MAALTAFGHLSDRSRVQGKWHIYPEMAAAGLWTTPSDLARFVIGVQQSFAGTFNPVVSQSMTTQMLTVQKDTDGLGVFLTGKDKTLQFSHNGRDEGFDTLMVATAQSGQGLNPSLLQYLSPLGWEHINLTGDYVWRSSAKVGAGKFRPLRPLPGTSQA